MTTGRHRLISADSHYTEPGDLFTTRVAAAFKDRVPRIERFDEGDAWVIEGVADPINFGMNACAGLPPEQMTPWMRFEDLRAGGYDSKVRVEEMNRDGVDAEVMYPTPRLSNAIFATSDEALHLAMVRAYNDWVCEYVSYAPERFGGLGLMPNRGGPKKVVAEMDRILDKPGMRGMVMGCYPNGTLAIEPEDDEVWAAHVDRGIPVNIHVALTQSMPARHKAKLHGFGRFFDAPNRMTDFIMAGVFDRFPTLDVMFAETDFGWVPYVREQIDNNYQRLDPVSKFGLQRLPSDYIDRHFHFGYMTDNVGLSGLHLMNPERVLWSTDYPHVSADYPYSWKTVQASMINVPAHQRALILHGNAERLYGFKPVAASVAAPRGEQNRPAVAA